VKLSGDADGPQLVIALRVLDYAVTVQKDGENHEVIPIITDQERDSRCDCQTDRPTTAPEDRRAFRESSL
jgi:hypothetical protein